MLTDGLHGNKPDKLSFNLTDMLTNRMHDNWSLILGTHFVSVWKFVIRYQSPLLYVRNPPAFRSAIMLQLLGPIWRPFFGLLVIGWKPFGWLAVRNPLLFCYFCYISVRLHLCMSECFCVWLLLFHVQLSLRFRCLYFCVYLLTSLWYYLELFMSSQSCV